MSEYIRLLLLVIVGGVSWYGLLTTDDVFIRALCALIAAATAVAALMLALGFPEVARDADDRRRDDDTPEIE